MDKRRAPRYAISLDALVHPEKGRSWLCTIKDFCAGGLLLVTQDSKRARRAAPIGSQGEKVSIHFNILTSKGDQHFRLEGKIARIVPDGMGVVLDKEMQEEVMTRLLEYSRRAPLTKEPREPRAGSSEQTSAAKTAAPAKPAAAQKDTRQTASLDLNSNRSETPAAARLGSRDNAPSQPARPGSAGTPPAAKPAEQTRSFRLTGSKPPPVAEPVPEAPSAVVKPLSPSIDISDVDAKQIIAGCRERTLTTMTEMTTVFFKFMADELLRMANEAKNNALQGEYFSAMALLEKSKSSLEQQIRDDVTSQIDQPQEVDDLLAKRQAIESARRQQQESRKIKISLVNADEFEDWLAVANIVTHAERAYESYLVEIQTRLGMLVDSWSHNEVNPFGPAVLTRAFDDALRTLTLTKDVRQKAYYGIEAKLVPILRKFYISIAKFLEDSGLFPEFDDHFITAGPIKIHEALLDREQDTDDETAVQEDDEDEDDEEFLLDDQLERGVAPKGAAPRPKSPARQQPQGASDPGQYFAKSEISTALRSVYSAVRSLMSGNQAPVEESDGEDQFSLEEVQDVLSQLQNQLPSKTRRPVREQVQEFMSAKGMQRKLSHVAAENLEVVENLVDNIEQDRLLSGSAKEWIRQLEVILSREATINPDFLSPDSDHGAVEVINQLAHLGASESAGVKRNVDDIVQRLVQNFDGSPQVYDEALRDLQPLMERQTRAFRGNVQRAVKASEGQQTLTNAQLNVLREMDERFSGREIPELLLKLLMPGWRNLMVNTQLRQGTKSADWKRNLNVLDQLLMQVDGNKDTTQSRAYMEPALLLKQIESGLDTIAYEPGQRAQLVEALGEMLKEGADTSKLPRVTLPAEGLAESLGMSDIKESQNKRAAIRENLESHPDWQRSLEEARNLFVGEWLEFINDTSEPEIAIVAWVSELQDKFVFVNRRGVQTHEYSVEELASLFLAETARILQEADIPLSERASHRMLQNMHNKLTHQATHDGLTGLANRKEFERELERALRRARKYDNQDLVVYMDLDQFKVINNTSGHDAGDALLIKIAEIIGKGIDAEKDILARLGGDEFGVLMHARPIDESMEILQKISAEIKALRFDWKGTQYSLTTSMGCVVINPATESVLQIMRSADSACYAAKDAGRDRIQMFASEDKKLVHRADIMEFVSQIDQALIDNRFVLNCQKISPIDPETDHLPHYEILLTILNAAGEPMPPQDFIIAAETYNRMGAIDRWVVKNSFHWIADNFLQLDKLGAFSINISGNSLNEPDFMDYVLQQFNETRLPTSRICFEITETAAISSLEGTIEFMEKMKVIGCEFSLDDFGTGLSSYSYLRNLPVDYLKIDGIFVKDIANNPNDYAVVKSINEIGHFMGKKTIAEYVENEEILEILREIGVDFAQGYGIEMKMPIGELL